MGNSDTTQYIDIISRTSSFKRRIFMLMPIFSLLVILVVFWGLKLTGVTLTGDAFCGIPEHTHSEECYTKTLICTEDTADTDGELNTVDTAITDETVSTADTIDQKTADTASDTTASDTTASETSDETIITSEETDSDPAETDDAPMTQSNTEDEPSETDAPAPGEKPVHVHDESCYVTTLTCTAEEHTHTSSCYSDLSADLETPEIWEATFADVPDDIAESDRLIQIAMTQLGYTESILNFVADTDGVRHGYTRYGEWFGNPHGEWSTMFTSFCLKYAGFENVSISAGANTLRIQWEEEGMYKSALSHSPIPGDIVFLDKNENGTPDATAIITAVTGSSLTVIEGDFDNCVAENEYEFGDVRITGYGLTAPKRVMMMASAPQAEMNNIGNTVSYSSNLLSDGGPFILYTQWTDGTYYAIDGYGNAVQIYIDGNGNITTAYEDTSSLLWSFSYCGTYDNRRSYYIQNSATGMYLHPHNENGTLLAVLSGRWESAIYTSGNGIKIRGARQNAYASLSNATSFTASSSLNQGSVFLFGIPPEQHDVWFDGTNGGLMSLGGSPDIHYSITDGTEIQLPSQWQSPDKYEYTLRGWYDIVNHKYYMPGAAVTVTGDTVFYADWVAASYDVGQFNSQVSDTVSTNDFVTVRMFDYNALFNLLSESVTTSISSSSHTETWSLITSGTNPYNGNATLNYIFRDWDRGNEDISYPRNTNDRNNPTNAGNVYPGLYNDTLGDLLFNPDNSFDPLTGTGVIGKQYLGTGDHLFHLMTDPNDEHYGYFFYDSGRNAASYNQSEQRFYVYEYLECTKDSANSTEGKYSDFLPLNSPYENTNGKNVSNYTYSGTNGEYSGVTHYMYDSRYSDNNNSTSNVGTNYWFGMSVEMSFYLPNSPGYVDEDGLYGNRDVYGNEMHFLFSGDDDVWVFVDGELVLDLGGVHGYESGDVNFSSGVVTVNGSRTGTIYDIAPGEHTLTIYYLERGSSLSNCAIYFNLAPRYGLNLQKEDVLTREYLNGAEFTVYTDEECTLAAELWKSEEDYKAGLPSTNVFTIENGSTYMWGLGAGNTYYIRETKPPDSEVYSVSHGIISLSLDKKGHVTYDVEILDDGGNTVSKGFTVHGFEIDEETREAYIVVTNADDTVTEVTSIQVTKKWADTKDHSDDHVTVYLSVKDPDGSIRRLREVIIGEENGWTYVWTNLPKYYADGVTLIEYLVEEAHMPGYSAVIQRVGQTDSFQYEITNNVLDPSNETSYTVYKDWNLGASPNVSYQQLRITVILLANGVDTGRSVTLSLKNNWTDVFLGLPYKDEDGNVIVYSVVEANPHEDWLPVYGEVNIKNTSPPSYDSTVTNMYRWGRGVELPSTGGAGQLPWILSGLGIMMCSLLSACMMRRKRERRNK